MTAWSPKKRPTSTRATEAWNRTLRRLIDPPFGSPDTAASWRFLEWQRLHPKPRQVPTDPEDEATCDMPSPHPPWDDSNPVLFAPRRVAPTPYREGELRPST